MQRGYFDDFRDFRDSKGKVFFGPEKLIPAAHVSFLGHEAQLGSAHGKGLARKRQKQWED